MNYTVIISCFDGQKTLHFQGNEEDAKADCQRFAAATNARWAVAYNEAGDKIAEYPLTQLTRYQIKPPERINPTMAEGHSSGDRLVAKFPAEDEDIDWKEAATVYALKNWASLGSNARDRLDWLATHIRTGQARERGGNPLAQFRALFPIMNEVTEAQILAAISEARR